MRYLPLGLLLTAMIFPMSGFAVDAQFQPDDIKNLPPTGMNEQSKYNKSNEQLRTAKNESVTDGEEIYTIEIKVKKMKNA